ncbi:MAG TPA: ABC transporter permease, partial [Cyclobacteriaceae bacterium]|nr:ABC transporter permease [Cyclobacteriaceae bacterium]
MFRHNLLLIFRNFKRFKSTFFINLIGLSSGLTCALLIYLWVHDELSTDRFHEMDSRLYQVFKNNPQADGTMETMPFTPAIMAQAMAEDLPE